MFVITRFEYYYHFHVILHYCIELFEKWTEKFLALSADNELGRAPETLVANTATHPMQSHTKSRASDSSIFTCL